MKSSTKGMVEDNVHIVLAYLILHLIGFHSIPSNQYRYTDLRPWIILTSTTIIATTSNIWIKPPAKPSNNPNSQRITRMATIVQIKAINLTSYNNRLYLD